MDRSLRISIVLLTVSFLVAEAAQAQQPVSLFDGESLSGWTRMDGKPVADDWEVVDGTLHLKSSPAGGANLFTEQEFTDFDLQFEWKIPPGGNNGLKYRVRQYGNQYLGLEYQMLDDAATPLNRRGMTGSLYELYEPAEDMQLNPVGEFNHSRVIVRGDHIEHWLNGRRILAAEVGSPEWYQRVQESKFRDKEEFGENRSGLIMLTAHGSEVWYRNIVLTPLPPPVEIYAATGPRPARYGRAILGFRMAGKRHANCWSVLSRNRISPPTQIGLSK